MVKKLIVPILLAVFSGGLLGTFLFQQYDKDDLQTVGKIEQAKEVYFYK